MHFIPFSFDAIDEVVENERVVTALEDSLNNGWFSVFEQSLVKPFLISTGLATLIALLCVLRIQGSIL